MTDPLTPAGDPGGMPGVTVVFGPQGTLEEADFAALRSMDGDGLGAAVAALVSAASSLPADLRVPAEEAIGRAFTDGPADGSPVRLDAARLVEVYREVVADPQREDVRALVAKLLASMDVYEVLATIPFDAAGLSLRARLEADIRDLLGTAMAVAEEPTRSFEDNWTGEAGGGDGELVAPGDVAPGDEAAGDEPAVAMAGGEPEPEPEPAPGIELVGPMVARQRYRAYGLLACDETVLAERTFPLELGLSKRQAAGVSGGPLRLPAPDRPYVVDVQLFADGFDLQPGEAWRHSLPVARTDDERTLYPTVTVHLTPRAQQDPMVDRKVSATFSIDGETLGLAERYIQVTTSEADLPPADAPVPVAAGANIAAPSGEPKAHLTITIRKGATEGTLTWGLVSTLPGIALPADRQVTSDIGENPQAFAKGLIQALYLPATGPACSSCSRASASGSATSCRSRCGTRSRPQDRRPSPIG